MANNKNPWIKYVVFLAIAIVLLVISHLKNNQFKQKRSKVLDFNKNDVTEISIYSSSDTVSFKQLNDSTWSPVEPDTGDIAERNVNRLLSSLTELEQTGTATENPDNFSTYSISDSIATRVDLKKGANTLASFYIASSRSSYKRGYLRFSDKNKVYRVSQNLTRLAQARPDYWQE